MANLVQCYNTNCGQKFDPAENHPEACTFHSGKPKFHDAYKGWECCGKRATDFTEFLNFKGCAKGPHNPVKPPEPERPKKTESSSVGNGDVIERHEAPKPPKPKVAAPRTLAMGEKSDLKKIVNATAKANFERLKAEREAKADGEKEEKKASGDSEILPGTSCKNNACKTEYQSEESNLDPCFYHPGVPIFHEGMKFWSCCKKKTTDFDNFMGQMGCEKGQHKWISDATDVETRLDCKRDFHQTPSQIILTIYAKASDPFNSNISATRVSITVHVVNVEQKTLDLDIPLWGEIEPEDSSVHFTPSKVEIKLRKADPISWPQYEYTGSN